MRYDARVTVTLDEVVEAARLTLAPGDRIVLTVPGYLTDEQFDDLLKRWRQNVPDVPVIIAEGGMTLSKLSAGPVPADVIEVAHTLSEEEFAEFKRRWEAEHATTCRMVDTTTVGEAANGERSEICTNPYCSTHSAKATA